MKLDFQDNLKRDAIDLTFRIKGDDTERYIYTNEANIKWSLGIESKGWGIGKFNYELIELLMPVTIDTVLDDGKIDSTTVQVEVKFNSNKKLQGYVCRIYENLLEDDEWKEEVFASFPINITVEESPSTEEGDRAQIFIKYIELNLDEDDRKLVLTI
jgi:hypothetical protein